MGIECAFSIRIMDGAGRGGERRRGVRKEARGEGRGNGREEGGAAKEGVREGGGVGGREELVGRRW